MNLENFPRKFNIILTDIATNRRVGLGNFVDMGIAFASVSCPALALGYFATDALYTYTTGHSIKTTLNGMAYAKW